ncbi:MAG: carboxypeptidase-like regulatory domain-containing protein [Fuerstiella sp.]
MNRLQLSAILAGLTVCVSGCGGSSSSPAPVYAVSGKVTFKNAPVVGADVTFFNAEKNRSAFGRTDSNGEYRLTTFSSNDGAVDGKAAVSILKFVDTAPTVPEPDIESEAYVPPGYGKKKPAADARPKMEIPDRYASQTTSGLIAVVAPDGTNTINFELTD